MKTLKLVAMGWLMAIAACTLPAEAPDEEVAEDAAELSEGLHVNALDESEQALVLKLIDDICGDTWCEGDHNFRFDRLECRPGCNARAGGCKLTFRLFSHDTDIETGPTYTRACRTSGFTDLESLVLTSGEYRSLQPAYYDALSRCISRVESRLPR